MLELGTPRRAAHSEPLRRSLRMRQTRLLLLHLFFLLFLQEGQLPPLCLEWHS